ncbi:uncharacterized protein LOC121918197 [Sceloporus undulatus]|uniref:uncharacterized protein LOC121918197 n=1 Tax=Sceloporus undulatus TaxID=8520 RepID=UPI001C4CD3D9|nr:uncharacterized protein LOC121918197 [Sceloporus undulatus]
MTASTRVELPLPFLHSDDEDDGKDGRGEEAPYLFFDSETGRYFMSVPRDVAVREFTRLNPHPTDSREGRPARSVPSASILDRPPPSPATASSAAPRRRSETSTARIPVRPRSQVRVPDIPVTSDTDSEEEPLPSSDIPSEDDDLSAPASPQRMHHPEPSSPSDDMRTFSEHVIKMARALDIELSFPKEEARDPVEHQVHGRVPTPPSIPLLPSLETIIQRSWDAPASLTGSSRKVESLYRVAPASCAWLAEHPKPNSAIVEGAQHSFVPKQATSPVDREAKKIDGLAKKAYSAASFAVKAIHYNACMGAYIQTLMERISPLVPDVPDEIQMQLVGSSPPPGMWQTVQEGLCRRRWRFGDTPG